VSVLGGVRQAVRSVWSAQSLSVTSHRRSHAEDDTLNTHDSPPAGHTSNSDSLQHTTTDSTHTSASIQSFNTRNGLHVVVLMPVPVDVDVSVSGGHV
jgi:hypothetical protein